MTKDWMRITARLLAVAWAGWWVFFGVASGLSEGLTPGGILMHAALPGGLFLVAALIAWYWETMGGVLLLLQGLAVVTMYPVIMRSPLPFSTLAFVLLTMGVPPLIAGCLLLWVGKNGFRGPVSGHDS